MVCGCEIEPCTNREVKAPSVMGMPVNSARDSVMLVCVERLP
jgi:hypothetical protein